MSHRVASRRLTLTRLMLELLEDRSMLDAGFAGYLANGEPNWIVSAQVIPNDTNFNQLWGMNNTGQSVQGVSGIADDDIDAPEAWDITTGTTKVTVGVIDSGIDYTHPDLYLNIWLNPGEVPAGLGCVDTDSDGLITFRDLNAAANNSRVTDLNANGYIDGGDLLSDPRWENGVDNDSNGYKDDLVGWNFVSNTNDPMDDMSVSGGIYHGTHCAGTIGAIGNNSRGVAGVNWTIQMAALKFLNSSGSGSIANAESAVRYATAAGIKITSNSWGGGGYSSSFENALQQAQAAGCIFVAAAGNSAQNNDAIANYPSNYPETNVVAVAASTSSDTLASFSCYGATTVDIAAPGTSIYSTRALNTYQYLDGTSMATPHVAGAIALLWGHEPTLTNDQVISRIYSTVDVKASLTGRVVTGGRLNIYNALAAGGPDVAGPRVTAATPNGVATASKLTITFNEAVNPSTFTLADIVSFTGPSGPIAVTGVAVVAGSGNTKFDLTFANQTTFGAYALTFGPNIADTLGNLMNQDGDAINGENPADRYTANFTLVDPNLFNFNSVAPVPISDYNTISSNITINQSLTISDVNVKLNITHTWDGDLRVYLRGPGGQIVNLTRYRGGSGDNFSNTTFDDEATGSITSGSAPFAGTYRPENALTAYDGKNAQGTWTLYVYDNNKGDVGVLSGWSLILYATPSGSAILSTGTVSETVADSGPMDAGLPVDKSASTTGSLIGGLVSSLKQERVQAGDLVSPTDVEDDTTVTAAVADDHRREAVSDLAFTTEDEGRHDELFTELAEVLTTEV